MIYDLNVIPALFIYARIVLHMLSDCRDEQVELEAWPSPAIDTPHEEAEVVFCQQ